MTSAGSARLWRAAATLGRRRRRGKGLPTVWFVTDPDRTPDPVAAASALPRGSGVILRHFGRPDAEETARRLVVVARRRGLVLLVAADEAMAARVGAAGVHLPERLAGRLARLKARRPRWIVTVAAHSPRALAAACGADGVLLSTVFASRSPTAGRPLGPLKLAMQARRASAPVYALGGVTAKTAGRLVGTGVAGFAAVEALS